MGDQPGKMENMVNYNLFGNVYNGKKVLITGITGFKGSWLSLWLKMLGADVLGIGLEPNTQPSHHQLSDISKYTKIIDINDSIKLQELFHSYCPEIVFHLAAQAIVKTSYENPTNTFITNIIGTCNVLEACRNTPSVRAIINVTSDKCYQNKEWIWGYRENDALGGEDPYSASKACSEILSASYRKSFLCSPNLPKNEHKLIANVRSGNVIGGGDWAPYRLIPDIVRAIVNEEKLTIRYPEAIRPWQHVLEPLSGYLLVGQHLLNRNFKIAEEWNFGPLNNSSLTVFQVFKMIQAIWNKFDFEISSPQLNHPETTLLRLDCSKALVNLQWKPVWSTNTAIEKSIIWYKDYYMNNKLNTFENINSYIHDAIAKQLIWTR